MEKKFLVTGAGGFIGSCLISRLNQQGISDIIAVDIEEDIPHDNKNLSGKRFSDYLGKDKLLLELKGNRLKGRVGCVLHMGACTDTTEKNKEFLKENNYEYSRMLAEWSLVNNKIFLYASSAATYGAGELGYSDDDSLTPRLKPLNEYGWSKLYFDKWIIDKGLSQDFTGFRFFNVFGPNEYHKGEMRSMVNKGYGQIKKTGKIRLFKSHRSDYKDGEQKRDFIYIKDALEMIWYFIEHPDKKGIFNIGTGRAVTWNRLAEAIFLAMAKKPSIEYFDMPPEIKDHYQYFTQADLARLRSAGCSYECCSIEDSVKDYIGYLKDNSYL